MQHFIVLMNLFFFFQEACDIIMSDFVKDWSTCGSMIVGFITDPEGEIYI